MKGRARLALAGLAALLLIGAVAALALRADGEASEHARLEQRLDRTAVHFHLALREGLEGPDAERVATAMLAARTEPEDARRLADHTLANRAAGAERLRAGRPFRRNLTASLVEPSQRRLSRDDEAAAFFLALLDESVNEDRSIPKQVLLYEGTALDLAAVEDPALQYLTRAALALVLSQGGYCERARQEASEVRVDTELPLPSELSELTELRPDLERAGAALAAAAIACCHIADNRDADAARALAEVMPAAEALGVADARARLLRGWIALAQGDDEQARAELERVDAAELSLDDSARLAMLRGALAPSAPESPQLTRRWVSAFMLSAVHEAFVRDGLLDALSADPEMRALRALAAGEGAVIAAARQRSPMFDQIHEADRDAFDRVRLLFE